MKKYWLTLAFLIIASAANAEPIQDSALAKTLEERFPDSTILAHSAECKSNANGPIQIGIVLQQKAKLHAIIAVYSANAWVVSDMPKTVEYDRGAMWDFLNDFDSAEARKQLEVRCINPKINAEINTRANGAFIKHRGEQNSAKHLCFPASDVYSSWVCYWTKLNGTKPELSFVQFNAD